MIGRDVIYRTDGRNGLVYDLPAKITVTRESHPGDYPDGRKNPLPVPDEHHVHLTVFTPGGFGTEVVKREGFNIHQPDDEHFPDAHSLKPGSGTYVEWNVPMAEDQVGGYATPRSWRWPE